MPKIHPGAQGHPPSHRFFPAALLFLLPFVCVADGGHPVSPGRIAVLSVVSPDYLDRVHLGLSSKRCYCLLRGYQYVLHTHDTSLGRKPHWARIPALERILPFVDWVFYSDADTLVTNSSVRLEAIVGHAEAAARAAGQAPPWLIVQDGMEINSGGFFVRNDPRAFDFLRAWWGLGRITVYRRYASSLNDQPPLMLALLAQAELTARLRSEPGALREEIDLLDFAVQRSRAVAACNEAEVDIYWQFVGCWGVTMARLGFPLGRRSAGGVFYYGDMSFVQPPSEGDSLRSGAVTRPPTRGFNMISVVGDPLAAAFLHPVRLWRPGDLLVHVTRTLANTSVLQRTRQFVPFFTAAGFPEICPVRDWVIRAPPSGTEMGADGVEDLGASSHLGCIASPCAHELWRIVDHGASPTADEGDDGTSAPRHGWDFRPENRWSTYRPPLERDPPTHSLCGPGYVATMRAGVDFVFANNDSIAADFVMDADEHFESRFLDLCMVKGEYRTFYKRSVHQVKEALKLHCEKKKDHNQSEE